MTTASQEPSFDRNAARALLREVNRVREEGSNETVVRQTLIAGLAEVFPRESRPWWVERHIRGAEAYLRFVTLDVQATGYADSVVGLTAIEYERDLRNAALYTEGKHQVRQYCAGLLNTGADPDKVRGVLSDGVEWHAYSLVDVPHKEPGDFSADDVLLHELERLEFTSDGPQFVTSLIRFLERHLGRTATRPLTAVSIVDYFGFNGGSAFVHLADLREAVEGAMEVDADAAELLRTVWTSFMAYLGTGASTFDLDGYVRELYLATLAKVMCANVVKCSSLQSEDDELDRILDGRFFEAKGLHRLVEHDYFGWLNKRDGILRPLARSLQSDLAAYDFERPPTDDLFGGLMAMLADRSQRILLGQEWTPRWLADRMVRRMADKLPAGELPRFVDMCCGSGTMVVATTALARGLLAARGEAPGTQHYLDALASAAIGFDIDPLAVILAKVNWVATNRDSLGALDGSLTVSMPIYHADSLFALALVFEDTGEDEQPDADYRIRLLDQAVALPRFLVQPERQGIFDALLDAAYRLAPAVAVASPRALGRATAQQVVADVEAHPGPGLGAHERRRAEDYLVAFVGALGHLIALGKDGIWVFLVRNNYRPGLVAGQFNGVLANPPWLTMSRVGNNPFVPVLRERASKYGLVPAGSAFLHLEMATVFLAHAVDHYLVDGGVFACVLPGTLRNGAQHMPFRAALTRPGDNSNGLMFRLDELWSIEPGTFKNRGMVAVGTKKSPTYAEAIPGKLVSRESTSDATFQVLSRGERLVWSVLGEQASFIRTYPRGRFAQGADLMPRRLLFHNTRQIAGGRVTVRPLEPDDPDYFLVRLAKKHASFRVEPRTLPARFAHRCLLSAHLVPFAVAPASTAILPVLDDDGRPRLASPGELAAGPGIADHLSQVLSESDFASLDDFWLRGLNLRSKLERQNLPSGKWLVVYGAGGGLPAAAFVRITEEDKVKLDQTLYWAVVESEDEALYLCGLINSNALLGLIQEFIPEGEFGDRHLHTLPTTAVPEYDATNVEHSCVVSATRALVRELGGRRDADATVAQLFTTVIPMTRRRSRMRVVLRGLDAYDEYDAACSALLNQ
jgi:hypothetical protein